jgi:hypothetical protein
LSQNNSSITFPRRKKVFPVNPKDFGTAAVVFSGVIIAKTKSKLGRECKTDLPALFKDWMQSGFKLIQKTSA